MLDIAQTYSVVSGGAMMLGLVTSGVVVDKLSRRYRSAPAMLPGTAFLLCVPFLIATFWAPSWQQALAFLFVPFMLIVMWTPPTLAILQNASPPETRASTSAIFITISSVIGNSLGPLSVGLLSDLLAAPETRNSLALALTALLPFFVVTGLTYYLVARATNRGIRNSAPALVEKPKPV